jgi:hypothetical protein
LNDNFVSRLKFFFVEFSQVHIRSRDSKFLRVVSSYGSCMTFVLIVFHLNICIRVTSMSLCITSKQHVLCTLPKISRRV